MFLFTSNSASSKLAEVNYIKIASLKVMSLRTSVFIYQSTASLNFNYLALFTHLKISKLIHKYYAKTKIWVDRAIAIAIGSIALLNVTTLKNAILPVVKYSKQSINANANKNRGIKFCVSKNQHITPYVFLHLAHGTLLKHQFVITHYISSPSSHSKNDIGELYSLEKLYFQKQLVQKINSHKVLSLITTIG
ncbi:hypothetical protein [Psychrobacter sanguinis]|uniref:Uncharacterized protein n=1 Tax=Psychrobacter sanguinis TaxID=861445 RepID=A0A844M373_9GAMM|nr:hypothetical protein [Psychrobacter sanguinis]MUG33399.1 hypothetical protein [Psychrobacter sanguinis]